MASCSSPPSSLHPPLLTSHHLSLKEGVLRPVGTGSLACVISLWYSLRRGNAPPLLAELTRDAVLGWVPDLNTVATLERRDGQCAVS